MSWWGWVILAAYLVGYVVAVPRIGYVVVNEVAFGKSGGADVAMGLALGALIGMAWPVVFPFYHWFKYAQARGISGYGLLCPPRPVRAREERERRERELQEREWRIKQLERELGVGAKR